MNTCKLHTVETVVSWNDAGTEGKDYNLRFEKKR